MVLFKLSEVLEKVMPGITSKNVKLVRHAADSVEINGMRVDGYTPYSLYISNPESFLLYQSEQRTDLFKNALEVLPVTRFTCYIADVLHI